MLRFPNPRRHQTAKRSEQGYILLMLMLFVALLAIAAGALAPTITFQVRRDREEEMIRPQECSTPEPSGGHCEEATGRYPSRLEELENTNNIRFLRKRYKDPITNKDFKLLHVGEVQLTGAAGIAGAAALGGGAIPGAATVGAMAQGASQLGAVASSMLGGSTNRVPTGGAATTTAASDDSAQEVSQSKTDSATTGQSQTDQGTSGGSEKLSSQVFGGGPIVVLPAQQGAKHSRVQSQEPLRKWHFIIIRQWIVAA